VVESEEEGRRLGDLLVEPEPLPGFLRPREVGSSSEEDDLDLDLDLPNLNFFMVLVVWWLSILLFVDRF